MKLGYTTKFMKNYKISVKFKIKVNLIDKTL